MKPYRIAAIWIHRFGAHGVIIRNRDNRQVAAFPLTDGTCKAVYDDLTQAAMPGRRHRKENAMKKIAKPAPKPTAKPGKKKGC
jgi:hypothetical protein